MDLSRRAFLAVLPGSLAMVASRTAWAAGQVVAASLWDKGADAIDGMDMAHMGMAMPDAASGKATMGITLDAATIPSGLVTFDITNDSGEFYHSLALAPVQDETRGLPYLADTRMLDEAALGTIARSKELRPHASGTLTVDLPPGTYILFCNIAGHYATGMWTLLTVTG